MKGVARAGVTKATADLDLEGEAEKLSMSNRGEYLGMTINI